MVCRSPSASGRTVRADAGELEAVHRRQRSVLQIDRRQADGLAVRERDVDGGVVGAGARAERLEPRAAHVQRRRAVGPQVAVERLDLGLPERVVGETNVAFVDAHEVDVHAAAGRRRRAAGALLAQLVEDRRDVVVARLAAHDVDARAIELQLLDTHARP